MKTALITGTSSGIGLELIKKFDKEGIRTISLSRSNIVSDHEFSSTLTHINFDITIEEDIKKIVQTSHDMGIQTSCDLLIDLPHQTFDEILHDILGLYSPKIPKTAGVG